MRIVFNCSMDSQKGVLFSKLQTVVQYFYFPHLKIIAFWLLQWPHLKITEAYFRGTNEILIEQGKKKITEKDASRKSKLTTKRILKFHILNSNNKPNTCFYRYRTNHIITNCHTYFVSILYDNHMPGECQWAFSCPKPFFSNTTSIIIQIAAH